jgi:DNA-binding NarL/FixJ family response regulator
MRFLIVDDHPFIRKGLIHVLQHEMSDTNPQVDEADSFEAAMELIRINDYDIVTVDISLSGTNGIHLLRQIKEEKPLMPVLIISTHGEEQYAVQTMKLGAAGYLSKHSAAEDLLTAIEQIRTTGRYISPKVALLLAEAVCSNSSPVSSAPDVLHTLLSAREMEIACLLAHGTQIKTIAFELGLSTKTVSTHRTRLLEKLGLSNNIALANYFSLHKLI